MTRADNIRSLLVLSCLGGEGSGERTHCNWCRAADDVEAMQAVVDADRALDAAQEAISEARMGQNFALADLHCHAAFEARQRRAKALQALDPQPSSGGTA